MDNHSTVLMPWFLFSCPECSYWSTACPHSRYLRVLETLGWRCEHPELLPHFKLIQWSFFYFWFLFSLHNIKKKFSVVFLSDLKLLLDHVNYHNKVNFLLELQMDLSAGIEAEYHHKNNRVDGLTHKHLGSIGLHSIWWASRRILHPTWFNNMGTPSEKMF